MQPHQSTDLQSPPLKLDFLVLVREQLALFQGNLCLLPLGNVPGDEDILISVLVLLCTPPRGARTETRETMKSKRGQEKKTPPKKGPTHGLLKGPHLDKDLASRPDNPGHLLGRSSRTYDMRVMPQQEGKHPNSKHLDGLHATSVVRKVVNDGHRDGCILRSYGSHRGHSVRWEHQQEPPATYTREGGGKHPVHHQAQTKAADR